VALIKHAANLLRLRHAGTGNAQKMRCGAGPSPSAPWRITLHQNFHSAVFHSVPYGGQVERLDELVFVVDVWANAPSLGVEVEAVEGAAQTVVV
jgi:hypothetical protein